MVNIEQNVAIHFIARDNVSGPLAIMGGALAGFAGTALKMATDFDSAFARVSSLLPDTKEQLEGMKQETMALSKSLGVDAVGAVNALYEAISSGVPKESAVSFLAIASKAAIAGVTDTKTAVDGLTSAVNAFRIPAGQVSEVADKMFMAVNIGKQTFEELSAAMYIAGPIAANTGVKLNELLAAQTSITKTGATASVAMTQIRSAITALNKPSENLTAILKGMGFESGQAAIAGLGLQGTLEGIRKGADELGIPLAKVFGRIEAVNATLSLTGQNSDAARADFDRLTNSTNAMGAAFDKLDDTPARRWAKAIVQLKDSMIELGNEGLPIFEALIAGMDGLGKGLDALPDFVQSGIVTFTALAAAALLVSSVLLKIHSLMPMLAKQFTSAGVNQAALTAATNSYATASARLIDLEVIKQGLMAQNIRYGWMWVEVNKQIAIATNEAATAQTAMMASAGSGMSKLAKASLWITAFVVAATALDMALKGFTGEGLFSRLTGGSDGSKEAKNAKEIANQIARIKSIQDSPAQSRSKDSYFSSLGRDIENAIDSYERLQQVAKKHPETTFNKVVFLGTTHTQEEKDAQEAKERLASTYKALSAAVLEYYGDTNALIDGVIKLKNQLNLTDEQFETFIKTTEAGTKYTKHLDLAWASAKTNFDIWVEGWKRANVFMSETPDKIQKILSPLEELIIAMNGGKEGAEDLAKGIDKAFDSLGKNSSKSLKLDVGIVIAEAEINSIKALSAGTRDLTDAEKKRIDQLEGYILNRKAAISADSDQVEIAKALKAEIDALGETQQKIMGGDYPNHLQQLAAELTNSAKTAPELVTIMDHLRNAMENTDPKKVATAFVEMTAALQKSGGNLRNLGDTFGKDFLTSLANSLTDKSSIEAIWGYVYQVFRIDLRPAGYETGASWVKGINAGITETTKSERVGGIFDGDKIVGHLNGGIDSILPNVKSAAEKIPEAFSAAWGDKAKDKVKTAIEGFVGSFEDTLRTSMLRVQFGDIGGDLIDKLVINIRDHTESTGAAVGTALANIVSKLRELRPGPEGEAWATELMAAIRNAIENGTPQAVQAAENAINRIKAILDRDLAIKGLNTLGDAISTALRNKYTSERKIAQDALDFRINAANKAYDAESKALAKAQQAAQRGAQASQKAASDAFNAQMKMANDAYAAQTKAMEKAHKAEIDAIDEAAKAQTDAIESQIDDLNQYLEIENRINDAIDYRNKISDLTNEYGRAKSNAERARIQKRIDKEVRDNESKLHGDAVKDRIDGLQKEMEVIKANADKQKEILNDLYNTQKERLEAAHQAQMDAMNAQQQAMQDSFAAQQQGMEDSFAAQQEAREKKKEADDKGFADDKKALDEYWDKKLSDENIRLEALAALQKGNMEEILALLKIYYPEWETAGLTLGEMLLRGLEGKKDDMADAIAKLFAPYFAMMEEIKNSDISVGGGGGGSGRSSTGITNLPRRTDTSLTNRHGGAFAGGTLGTSGGLAWAGENGPELINMPSGTSVSSTSRTQELIRNAVTAALGSSSGGGAGDIEVNVFIGKEKLDSAIVKSLTRSSRNTY